MKILIKSPCSASVIIQYGIKNWPIGEYEPSIFQYKYNEKEICLIIEGQAIIKSLEGATYNIKSGDFIAFPAGFSCEWEIIRKIKKHYRLGE